jgi:hypothetical protein
MPAEESSTAIPLNRLRVSDCWSESTIERNPVRQLAVPAQDLVPVLQLPSNWKSVNGWVVDQRPHPLRSLPVTRMRSSLPKGTIRAGYKVFELHK